MQRARWCFAFHSGHTLQVVGPDGILNCIGRFFAFYLTTALRVFVFDLAAALRVLPRVAYEAIFTAAPSSAAKPRTIPLLIATAAVALVPHWAAVMPPVVVPAATFTALLVPRTILSFRTPLTPYDDAHLRAHAPAWPVAPALLHSAALTPVLTSRLTTAVVIAVALPTLLPLATVLLLVVAISPAVVPAAAAAPTVAALIVPISAATTVSISRPIVSTAVAHSCVRRTGSSQCR